MKLKMAAIFITIVFAISVLGVGTIYASQDSLPGDVLYPVKLGTERARLLTAANDIDRAEGYLEIANIRIEEIGALAEREQPDKVNIAVNGYDEAIGMAILNMNEAKAKGLEISEVAELVDEATKKHIAVLEEVLGIVPEQAKPAIERAMEMSIIGNERAAEALEEAGPPLEDGIPPGELPKPEEGTEEGITSEDKEESSDKAEGIKEKIKEKLRNIIPQGKGTPLSQ